LVMGAGCCYCRLPEVKESVELLALYSTYIRERQQQRGQIQYAAGSAAEEAGGQVLAYAAVDIEGSGGTNAVVQRLRVLPWYRGQIQHEELFLGCFICSVQAVNLAYISVHVVAC
jgi:hypothetical protein